MREDKPARWLAIWPASIRRERYKWELPFIGAEQDGRFYHYGGRTHMPMSDRNVVLKEYGRMTVEEWEDRGGEDQWYADFPPVSSPAEEYSDNVDSWIDPDGVIYLCNPEGHEFLAMRLCKHLGIVEPDKSLNCYGDILDKRGWNKLHCYHIFKEDCSQKQLDALFDILMVLERKRESKYLCDDIREALDIKPADGWPRGKSGADTDN